MLAADDVLAQIHYLVHAPNKASVASTYWISMRCMHNKFPRICYTIFQNHLANLCANYAKQYGKILRRRVNLYGPLRQPRSTPSTSEHAPNASMKLFEDHLMHKTILILYHYVILASKNLPKSRHHGHGQQPNKKQTTHQQSQKKLCCPASQIAIKTKSGHLAGHCPMIFQTKFCSKIPSKTYHLIRKCHILPT